MDHYNKPSPFELAHHGILGQKWGVRNGPPYPLGSSDHSARERKAGWRKSLDKEKKTSNNKSDSSGEEKAKRGLTSGQKKAIAIGAVTAAALLATYGAYKLGYLDRFRSAGAAFAAKNGDLTVKGFPSSVVKKLAQPEGIDTVLSKVNPSGNHDNCYNVVVATTARLCGFDVTAKGDTRGGKGMAFDDVCRVFKLKDNGTDIRTMYDPSMEKLARFIRKKYSEGDVGIIGVHWRRGGAHVLNWIIRDGSVEFIDGQINRRGPQFLQAISELLDPGKEASIARLANIGLGLDLENDIDLGLFLRMVNV